MIADLCNSTSALFKHHHHHHHLQRGSFKWSTSVTSHTQHTRRVALRYYLIGHTYGHWPKLKVRAISFPSRVLASYRLFFLFLGKSKHQTRRHRSFRSHLLNRHTQQCVQTTLTLSVRFVRPEINEKKKYILQILFVHQPGLANSTEHIAIGTNRVH